MVLILHPAMETSSDPPLVCSTPASSRSVRPVCFNTEQKPLTQLTASVSSIRVRLQLTSWPTGRWGCLPPLISWREARRHHVKSLSAKSGEPVKGPSGRRNFQKEQCSLSLRRQRKLHMKVVKLPRVPEEAHSPLDIKARRWSPKVNLKRHIYLHPG